LKAISDDRIKYEIVDCVEPSKISPPTSLGFSLVKHTTKQIFPEAVVVPS
jgi:hypothetical protein